MWVGLGWIFFHPPWWVGSKNPPNPTHAHPLLRRYVKNGENPPKDLEHNRRAEERPRALLGEIRVISGWPSKATRVDNLVISFTEDNARWLHHPYDDALVVSLLIANFNTRRVLVDNGSSVDILYYPVFQQMRIDREHLLPFDAPLVGFGGTKVFPMGTITLPVTIGTYPQ